MGELRPVFCLYIVLSVHSLNMIALPGQPNGLPLLAKLFCPAPVSIPVSVPVRPGVALVSFAPLCSVSGVTPLQGIGFGWSCAVVLAGRLWRLWLLAYGR